MLAVLYWDPDGVSTNNVIATGAGLGGRSAGQPQERRHTDVHGQPARLRWYLPLRREPPFLRFLHRRWI